MSETQNSRVTQADKQAADAFWMVHGPFAWGTVATLAEAFARHREAAEAEAKAREAALVEALHLAASRFQVASVDAIRAGETRLSADCIAWANDCTRAALTKEPDV